MRKSFKKIICGILSFMLAGSSLALYAGAYNVGDKIGKILSTDIITCVEGVRVRSYNIKGRTAVVAQDLNALGGSANFGVSFDEASRVLTISNEDVYKTGSAEALIFTESGKKPAVGTPVGDVLYTDITTNFDGKYIESFNIGGLTCIYADDLGKLCGTYLWDENARTVNVFRNGSYIPYAEKISSGKGIYAEDSILTKSETFDRWGSPVRSNLIRNNDGTYTAVTDAEHINIEKYSRDFNLVASFAIKKELPIFGGLMAGAEYNYIVFGQENLLEDNSREVIRIVVYDKNFVKLREISVANCKTAVPFDASGVSMSENDNYLVVHTSRSQYLDENNSRPQTQLTLIVDKKEWKVRNILGKFQYNHTSHSLQQFVKLDGERIITANYSDAAPVRGAFLQELDPDGKVMFTQSIFNVGGALAANCTGGMIGGLEISENGCLVPVSTIDHSLPAGYSSIDITGIEKETRDIYLLWTDKMNLTQKHTCLARYTGTGLTGSVPYIVKLQNGKCMVLWQRFNDTEETSNTVCYAFFDSLGNQVGGTYTVTAQLSEDCVPIEADGKVVWYVNTPAGRDFYRINSVLPEKKTEEPSVEKEEKTEEKITEVDGI